MVLYSAIKELAEWRLMCFEEEVKGCFILPLRMNLMERELKLGCNKLGQCDASWVWRGEKIWRDVDGVGKRNKSVWMGVFSVYYILFPYQLQSYFPLFLLHPTFTCPEFKFISPLYSPLLLFSSSSFAFSAHLFLGVNILTAFRPAEKKLTGLRYGMPGVCVYIKHGVICCPAVL